MMSLKDFICADVIEDEVKIFLKTEATKKREPKTMVPLASNEVLVVGLSGSGPQKRNGQTLAQAFT